MISMEYFMHIFRNWQFNDVDGIVFFISRSEKSFCLPSASIMQWLLLDDGMSNEILTSSWLTKYSKYNNTMTVKEAFQSTPNIRCNGKLCHFMAMHIGSAYGWIGMEYQYLLHPNIKDIFHRVFGGLLLSWTSSWYATIFYPSTLSSLSFPLVWLYNIVPAWTFSLYSCSTNMHIMIDKTYVAKVPFHQPLMESASTRNFCHIMMIIISRVCGKTNMKHTRTQTTLNVAETATSKI